MTQISMFEISDYLNNEDDVINYLALAIADENPDVFIAALGHATKAAGEGKCRYSYAYRRRRDYQGNRAQK